LRPFWIARGKETRPFPLHGWRLPHATSRSARYEFPNLYDDTKRAKALAQLGPIAFKPVLEEAVRQFEEKNPSADLLLCEIPGVEMIPILFDLGGTIKESLEAQRNAVAGRLNVLPNGNELLKKLPVAGFSHKIDCFGHDVTTLMGNIRLTRAVLAPEPHATASDLEKDSGLVYPDGTKVNLSAVFGRIGRRMKNHLEIVIRNYQGLGANSSLLWHDALGMRDHIREILGNGNDYDQKWINFKQDVFERAFSFRRDEALEPQDLLDIQLRINDFNGIIHALVNARPSNRILFPSNQLFASIVANGFYTIGDYPGVTVFPTLNGGLFSFDGVHPGFVGHAILADEMRKTLQQAAFARASKTVGGVPLEDFRGVPNNLINKFYFSDPAIDYIRHNQMPPP
jgi:hypothetical protein